MQEFWNIILRQLPVTVFLYLAVIGFIFADLWSGIRKAKSAGEYRSSYGLRKTIKKISEYFNMMIVVTIIDILQMLACWELSTQTAHSLPVFQFVTIVGTILVGIIELKSIFENKDKKEQARLTEAVKVVAEIMKDKDRKEAFETFVSYLSSAPAKEKGEGNG